MKKTLAVILSLVFVLSLIPFTASAENTESYRNVNYQTKIQTGTPATTTMTFMNYEVLTDYGYGSAAGFTASLEGGKTYTISFVATTQYNVPHNVNLVVMPNALKGSGVAFLGDNLTKSVDVENLGTIAGTAVKFTAPSSGDYKILITEGSLLIDDYKMVPVTCTVAVNEYAEKKYSVSSFSLLSEIRDKVNNFTEFTCEMNIALTADISCDSSVTWNNFNNFCGTFDGNGKTISNLTLGNDSGYNVSLLGKVMAGAVIKNLTMSLANVQGLVHGGAIAGMLRDSTMTDCHSTGIIKCGTNAGGLIGSAINSTVSGCTSGCSVRAVVGSAGGLIGSAANTTIADCSASGSVQGIDNIGGFIGISSASTITDCTSAGNAEGSIAANDIGGFVGCASNGDAITRCLASGNASGNTAVGGFIGEAVALVKLNECRAEGASVKGNASLGGFAGKIGSSVTILNSYAKGAVSTRTEMRTNTNIGGFAGTIAGTKNTIGNSYTISSLDIYADKVGLFAGSMELIGACKFIGCYTAGNSNVDNCATSGMFVGKFASNNNTESSFTSCCYNSDASIVVNGGAPIWSTNYIKAFSFSIEEDIKDMEKLLNKCAEENGFNEWKGRNSLGGPELVFSSPDDGNEDIDDVIDWVKEQSIILQIPLWIFYVPIQFIISAIKGIF